MSLYNAVNGTNYTDADKIQFNTIREVLYLGMHNDISFLIDVQDLYTEMNLYEEQSYLCPNMPLRKLQYAGNLYEKYLVDHKLNKYGRTQLKLPVPRLVTFYIGTEDKPDETILRLSDSFPEGAESDIEVKVRMININPGRSRELLNSCQPLKEYVWLIGMIRENKKVMALGDAVDQAIDDMPDGYVLKKVLVSHRVEVKDMLLTEYNETETMEMFKQEGWEEGLEKGMEKGRKEGMEKGRKEGREEGREEEKIFSIRNLMETLSLTAQQAMDALKIAKNEQEKYLSRL